MLDRKQQPPNIQSNYCFKVVQNNFETVSYRLAAEFILLYDRPDMDEYLAQLKNASDFECVFSVGDIDNEFIRNGRFIQCDKNIVGRKLYDSLTSFWLYDDNEKLKNYKDFFYKQFFEKLCCIQTVPQLVELPAKVGGKIGGFNRFVEFELLRKLIFGAIAKGDSVMEVFFPCSDRSDRDISEVKDHYHDHFLRLFDRRASDLVLV